MRFWWKSPGNFAKSGNLKIPIIVKFGENCQISDFPGQLGWLEKNRFCGLKDFQIAHSKSNFGIKGKYGLRITYCEGRIQRVKQRVISPQLEDWAYSDHLNSYTQHVSAKIEGKTTSCTEIVLNGAARKQAIWNKELSKRFGEGQRRCKENFKNFTNFMPIRIIHSLNLAHFLDKCAVYFSYFSHS